MASEDEITRWLLQLAEGDEEAARIICQEYFAKLARFARRKLDKTPLRVFDEEDIALSALKSFLGGMARGRFPLLEGRDDLWRLLVIITVRKISDQRRRAGRMKRGPRGGRVRGESVFLLPDGEREIEGGISEVLGSEPTPELAAMMVENLEALLGCLDDEVLRQIAELKLEGWTNGEIAGKMGCVRRTIERKLERIREKWEEIGAKPD